MKKTAILLASLMLSATVYARDGSVDFSGTAQTLWGSSLERFTLGETSFTGKLDAWFGDSSVLAEGTVTFDALGDLTDFSLSELWMDYTSETWGVRAGRQKIVWGKADGVSITNVVSPSDMTALSSLVGDDSLLPVDALNFSLTGQSVTLDAFWIPFFSGTRLPLEEGNSLRKYVVPESIDFEVPALGKTFVLPVSVSDFTEPEKVLWNGEYGARASGYFSLCDVSAYAFYGWENLPLLDYTVTYAEAVDPYPALPDGLTVSGEYKRVAMFGMDAAVPIGEIVLRTECAFFPKRHFQKSAEKIIEEKSGGDGSDFSEQHNEVSALAGLDWMPSGWTVTAQYYMDYVFGDMESLDRTNAYAHGATLSVSRTFFSETLKLSLSGVLGLNDFDSLVAPSARYSLSDQMSIESGAYLFFEGPERAGKYGAYKDLSTVYIQARFCF